MIEIEETGATIEMETAGIEEMTSETEEIEMMIGETGGELMTEIEDAEIEKTKITKKMMEGEEEKIVTENTIKIIQETKIETRSKVKTKRKTRAGTGTEKSHITLITVTKIRKKRRERGLKSTMMMTITKEKAVARSIRNHTNLVAMKKATVTRRKRRKRRIKTRMRREGTGRVRRRRERFQETGVNGMIRHGAGMNMMIDTNVS